MNNRQTRHEDIHSHRHVHPDNGQMLSVEDALDRVLALVEPLESSMTALLDADGLTLAEDVVAPFDVPALANSGMDGYAVRATDVLLATAASEVVLPVVDQIQAGQIPAGPLPPRAAVRIMTGAPVPDGADAIIPYELTDEVERRAGGWSSTEIGIRHAPVAGEHVRPAGEDATLGQMVLPKGRVLDPPAIGLLATFGYATVPVVRRPRVAILATGDEVQAPGTTLGPGSLFDSNSYGIAAAIRRWGAVPHLIGIARDNMKDLRAKLRKGLEADLLVTSAGVSAGAFDMVKEVLKELGTIDFWAVRMRPARPIAFGRLNAAGGRKVPMLGLPGNPVSALVALIEFGYPAIGKMMGNSAKPLPTVRAILEDPILNTDSRRVYARVLIEKRNGTLFARSTGAQGSNILTSMALAEGLAICHEDLERRDAGEEVVVQLLNWRDQFDLLTESLDITIL